MSLFLGLFSSDVIQKFLFSLNIHQHIIFSLSHDNAYKRQTAKPTYKTTLLTKICWCLFVEILISSVAFYSQYIFPHSQAMFILGEKLFSIQAAFDDSEYFALVSAQIDDIQMKTISKYKPASFRCRIPTARGRSFFSTTSSLICSG